MPKLVRSFSLIAVHEPEGSETFTLKAVPDVPVLNANNVQQGEVVFYVEHKLGSDTDKTPAFFTVRYLNASLEVAVEQYPAQQKEASQLTDTDGSVLTDTDGAELYDTDGVIGGAASEKLEELHFTWPATKYGYASVLKVEAYEDESRTVLIAEGTFTFTRELPVYKARGEEWNEKLTYHNGEFILLNDQVYMWSYPIPGNSTISPDLDIDQNKQGLILKDDKTHWTIYTEWPLIATRLLFSQFALLGGAVMAGKINAKSGAYDYAKMYSQTGRATDSSQDDTSYPSFNPALEPYDSAQKWNPKACIDWRTGKSWFSDTTISGEIYASNGGKIGPFEITKDYDMHITSSYIDSGIKTYMSQQITADLIRFRNADFTKTVALGVNGTTPAGTQQGQLVIYDVSSEALNCGASIYVKGTQGTYAGAVYKNPKTALVLEAVQDFDIALDIKGNINIHGKDYWSGSADINSVSDYGITEFVHIEHVFDQGTGRFFNAKLYFKNGLLVGINKFA